MLEYWRSHLPAEVPAAGPAHRQAPARRADAQRRLRVLRARRRAQRPGPRSGAGARRAPFMVLLSAYYLLLHRYSGPGPHRRRQPGDRSDARRNSPRSTATSSTRCRCTRTCPAGPTVAELLDQVRTTVLNGLDNQEYPFVLLVEELGLQHDPSRSAVFQAMFILLTHKVATEQYGYRLEYIELPRRKASSTSPCRPTRTRRRAGSTASSSTTPTSSCRRPRAAWPAHYVHLLDGMTRAPSHLPTPGWRCSDRASGSGW